MPVMYGHALVSTDPTADVHEPVSGYPESQHLSCQSSIIRFCASTICSLTLLQVFGVRLWLSKMVGRKTMYNSPQI